MHNLDAIQHPSAVFAVALSRDGRLLALGGASRDPSGNAFPASVSVWTLEDGRQIAQIGGIEGQVKVLAFSYDAARLACVNDKGGLWIWETASGNLVQQQAPESDVLFDSLAFRDDAPLLLSRPINTYYQIQALSPDGKVRAVSSFNDYTPAYAEVIVKPYGSDEGMAAVKVARYEPADSGPRHLRWSADSRALGLVGSMGRQDGCGVWLYSKDKFWIRAMPVSEEVHDLLVLPGNTRLACATGKSSLIVVDMPTEPALTRWQAYKKRRDAEPPKFTGDPKHDWQWGVEGMIGHDGVHTWENQIVWYSNPYNPHAGGGASTQSFEDFLENGPYLKPPDDNILDQLYDAVKALTRKD